MNFLFKSLLCSAAFSHTTQIYMSEGEEEFGAQGLINPNIIDPIQCLQEAEKQMAERWCTRY